MNKRDLEIFLRGFHVGLKIAEDFETGLPQKESTAKKTRNTRGKAWTDEEDIIVSDESLSMTERIELLPGRNKASIYNRISYMKKKNNKLANLGQ